MRSLTSWPICQDPCSTCRNAVIPREGARENSIRGRISRFLEFDERPKNVAADVVARDMSVYGVVKPAVAVHLADDRRDDVLFPQLAHATHNLAVGEAGERTDFLAPVGAELSIGVDAVAECEHHGPAVGAHTPARHHARSLLGKRRVASGIGPREGIARISHLVSVEQHMTTCLLNCSSINRSQAVVLALHEFLMRNTLSSPFVTSLSTMAHKT